MQPGYVEGRHYTDWVNEVKSLRRSGEVEEAERLLLRLVHAVEAEAAAEGWGVAPWYYEQLAILYRGEGRRSDEVQILERFAAQPHAPGVKPAKLLDRLRTARARDDQTE